MKRSLFHSPVASCLHVPAATQGARARKRQGNSIAITHVAVPSIHFDLQFEERLSRALYGREGTNCSVVRNRLINFSKQALLLLTATHHNDCSSTPRPSALRPLRALLDSRLTRTSPVHILSRDTPLSIFFSFTFLCYGRYLKACFIASGHPVVITRRIYQLGISSPHVWSNFTQA